MALNISQFHYFSMLTSNLFLLLLVSMIKSSMDMYRDTINNMDRMYPLNKRERDFFPISTRSALITDYNLLHRRTGRQSLQILHSLQYKLHVMDRHNNFFPSLIHTSAIFYDVWCVIVAVFYPTSSLCHLFGGRN